MRLQKIIPHSDLNFGNRSLLSDEYMLAFYKKFCEMIKSRMWNFRRGKNSKYEDKDFLQVFFYSEIIGRSIHHTSELLNKQLLSKKKGRPKIFSDGRKKRIVPHQTEVSRLRWFSALIMALFLTLMLYATSGLSERGDPQAPANVHVSPTYIEDSMEDTHTPNIVTAVLADYRGYDTLGETVVIFTAGLACALILMKRKSYGRTCDRTKSVGQRHPMADPRVAEASFALRKCAGLPPEGLSTGRVPASQVAVDAQREKPLRRRVVGRGGAGSAVPALVAGRVASVVAAGIVLSPELPAGEGV